MKVILYTQGSAEYNAKSYGVWFSKFQGGTSKDSCCAQWYFPSKSLKHYDESRRWDYREIFKFMGYAFLFRILLKKNTIMREGKTEYQIKCYWVGAWIVWSFLAIATVETHCIVFES